MQPAPHALTLLLRRAHTDPAARVELYPLVREELYRIARGYMRGQPAGHTLQATQLVDMAFGELVANRIIEWEDRNHFRRVAARVMWNDLVDHARRKRPELASPAQQAAQPDLKQHDAEAHLDREETLLAIHAALAELEKADPESAEVFRIRCFVEWQSRFDASGPEVIERSEPLDRLRAFQEVGEILGIPHSTAHRRYGAALQYLRNRLGDFEPNQP